MSTAATSSPAVGQEDGTHINHKLKSQALPTKDKLEALCEMKVLDKDKQSVAFGSLVKGTPHPRNIIIFVRHFFCGSCQEYVRALSASLPPSRLSALTPPTSLAIVGCGDPALIPAYVKETSCPFPMYADPTRAIYDHLGFVCNLDTRTSKPKYIGVSILSSTLNAIRQGLGAGAKALNGGKVSQNGGDMVWVDGQCVFLHTMRNTMDHLEVDELAQVLQ